MQIFIFKSFDFLLFLYPQHFITFNNTLYALLFLLITQVFPQQKVPFLFPKKRNFLSLKHVTNNSKKSSRRKLLISRCDPVCRKKMNLSLVCFLPSFKQFTILCLFFLFKVWQGWISPYAITSNYNFLFFFTDSFLCCFHEGCHEGT